MGDSDDEYDRKRRDKFRGERSDYRDARRPPPAGAGDDRRRDDWQDRGSDWNRVARGPPVRPMEYRLGGRPREFSPPNKRPRADWDRYSHDSYGSSGYGSGFDPPAPHGGYHGPSPGSQRSEHSEGGLHVLSFKSWLSTQDDSISDQDALTKYAEYKQEFKRQQLNEFFVAHREEEWFKNKYHPDESSRRKEEQHQNLMKRVNLFMEFLNQNRFDEITLDAPNSDKIAKLMDWYVVRLEGGTDEDAKKLLSDEPKPAWSAPTPAKPEAAKPAEPAAGKDDSAEVAENGSGTKRRKSHTSASKDEDWSAASGSESDGAASPKLKKGKLSEDSTDGKAKTDDAEEDAGTPMEADTENISADEDEKEVKEVKPKKVRSTSESGHSNGPAEDGEDEGKSAEGDKKEKEKTREVITIEPDGPPQLHRTASVFLRNLSPAVPKAEVEALCQKYPGFLRAALADPQPERRWYRRGWVTFKRDVNIKEICWQLNNIRLKDAELGAIVNRDLTRRVRCVSGITPHKMIVRNDIRLAAQVIQFLDSKWNLWDEDSNQDKKESFGVYSTNPVLKNITDYLIEEASAEEDELLGMGGGGGSDGEIDADETRKGKNNEIERDEELIKVLDRLILYLRFVHSLDYYNHAEYPYEDDMPNRLGIMHGRGVSSSGDVNLMELQEYNRNFEQKISTFCQKTSLLTDEEVKVMGMKDETSEVEKFIQANTQELGKDKWLCPLSGKKFKGPEFVRKHIENKHPEKLEEVKKEVAFFNNYLRDPKRPKTPERKDLTQTHYPPPQMGGPRREPMMDRGDYHQPPFPPYGGYGGGPGYGGGYGGPPRGYQPYGGGGFNGPPRGRAGGYRGRGDGNRPMISYRDLDAPPDDDF